jgi:hypothetical protein
MTGRLRDTSAVVPVELVWMAGRPVVTLRALPAGRRDEPFWEDELAQAVGRPVLLPLDRAPDPEPGWRPAGFIFHMLRCGSTLTCKLLEEFPGVVALSEPPIFQSLLTGPGEPGTRTVWLRRLMALHASAFQDLGRHLIIKWSSVSGCYVQEILAAFPGVPAVFVHRDPVEVLVSCVEGTPKNARLLEPRHFVPHLRPSTVAEVRAMPFADLVAHFLASCCAHAAAAGDGLRRVDYRSLPDAVWTGLSDYFGLPAPDSAVLRALERRSSVDVKDPRGARRFLADSQRKHASATDEIRDLARCVVQPELDRLAATHPLVPLTSGKSSR